MTFDRATRPAEDLIGFELREEQDDGTDDHVAQKDQKDQDRSSFAQQGAAQPQPDQPGDDSGAQLLRNNSSSVSAVDTGRHETEGGQALEETREEDELEGTRELLSDDEREAIDNQETFLKPTKEGMTFLVNGMSKSQASVMEMKQSMDDMKSRNAQDRIRIANQVSEQRRKLWKSEV